MKSKSLIMLFVSLGFGLIAAIGISQVMGRNKAGGEPVIQKVPVVLAKVTIDHDSELTGDTLAVEEWPINVVPENAVQSLQELENMIVAVPVMKGLPLLRPNLVDKSKARVLAIPADKSLMTISLDSDDAMPGLLQPGNKIDLIGLFKTREGGRDIFTPRTFLRNIKVFSIDGNFRRDVTGETPVSTKGKSNVGVLVNQKESEFLTAVIRSSTKLKVVLRPEDGNEESEIVMPFGEQQGLSPEEALQALISEVVPKQETAVAGVSHQTVVWNGAERTTTSFDAMGGIIDPATKPAQTAPVDRPGGMSSYNGESGFKDAAESNYEFEEDQYRESPNR